MDFLQKVSSFYVHFYVYMFVILSSIFILCSVSSLYVHSLTEPIDNFHIRLWEKRAAVPAKPAFSPPSFPGIFAIRFRFLVFLLRLLTKNSCRFSACGSDIIRKLCIFLRLFYVIYVCFELYGNLCQLSQRNFYHIQPRIPSLFNFPSRRRRCVFHI